MQSLLAITWTVSPEIFDIGPLHIRWYGLCFATAFFIGYKLISYMFKKENIQKDWVESLFLYVMLGTVIGARLGHVIFYDFEDYLANPIDIIKIWEGGLASHGAAVGILIALWLFSTRVSKKPMIWAVDRVVITVAIGGFFVRIGNLMNHEIIGMPTDLPWGFIFTKHTVYKDIPCHPAQLYEAIGYIIVFGVLWWMYQKTNAKSKQGYIFGIFLILLFGVRFLVEFVKYDQGGFGNSLGNILSTGQWLSIPFIIAGIIFMVRANKTATT